jgi:DNA-binding XRE family transcriptional regulator
MEEDVTQVVTPDGRVLVLLPLELYESLSDRAGAGSPFRPGYAASTPPEVRGDIAAGHAPLAAWRRHRDLTQNELSILSGVSRHTIMRIEAGGEGAGSQASRRRLAEALGIGINEL